MYMKAINRLLVIPFFVIVSCGDAFLEVKPEQRQRIPNSVADYVALMDNVNYMNRLSPHVLAIVGSDEIYVSEAQYNSFPAAARYNYLKNAYTWEKQIFEGGEGPTLGWTSAYQSILWANMAIEGLGKIGTNEELATLGKGMALFHRAYNHFSLAQLYCATYNEETARTDLGLPLRMETDVTVAVGRSSVFDTYRAIENDLLEAIDLLPDLPITVFRPSKAAAYAMLARVHLIKEDYASAGEFANRCLSLTSKLLDYNTLSFDGNYTFPLDGHGNDEVIFMTTMEFSIILPGSYSSIDTNLMSSYMEGDLRKHAYFSENSSGDYQFAGSYSGNHLPFTGISTDEMYLIRAESAARLGDLHQSLQDLNLLRKYRFSTDAHTPLISGDVSQVLGWIFLERQKELVLRGTRWTDLRRLNRNPLTAKTLLRELNGRRYELQSGDSRYILPLPVEAIQIGGYRQNER